MDFKQVVKLCGTSCPEFPRNFNLAAADVSCDLRTIVKYVARGVGGPFYFITALFGLACNPILSTEVFTIAAVIHLTPLMLSSLSLMLIFVSNEINFQQKHFAEFEQLHTNETR